MKSVGDRRWELGGYGLWLLGSVLFAIVGVRNRDWLSFVASLLFVVGIVAVMVPMARTKRDSE